MYIILLTLIIICIPTSAHAFGFTAAAMVGALTVSGVAGTALTTTGALVGAGLTGLAGFAGFKALSALSGGKTETPKVQSVQTPGSDGGQSAAEAKVKADIDKKRKGVARNKTVYTNPVGLTPKDKSEASLKTLTGV